MSTIETEWGPDVYSATLETKEDMVFPKKIPTGEGIPKFPRGTKIPEEVAHLKGKVIEKRIVIMPDDRTISHEGQLRDSYDYHHLLTENTKYGPIRDVMGNIHKSSTKMGIEEFYVDCLLEAAKPGMTPEELHFGAVEKVAEDFLEDKLKEYLKGINVKHTKEMSSAVFKVAQNNEVFLYNKKFREMLEETLIGGMISYLASKK